MLDFAAVFEIRSTASRLHEHRHFHVSFVADHAPLASIDGMRVCSQNTFNELRSPDIVVLPCGDDTRTALRNNARLRWAVVQAELVTPERSCARILAALIFDNLTELESTPSFCRDARFPDAGRIVISARITAASGSLDAVRLGTRT